MRIERIDDPALRFSAEGWMSNANWASKKLHFSCFINSASCLVAVLTSDRLVDCPSLKKSLDAMYALVLPRGRRPWIYVSLELDPSCVDVNVHPTKQEVHFLDEDEIVERFTSHAQAILATHSSSRVLGLTQTQLPGDGGDESHVQVTAAHVAAKYDPRRMIRVDHASQTLDAMLPVQSTGGAASAGPPAAGDERIAESENDLLSVRQLREDVEREQRVSLSHTLQNHVFVGVVDLCKGHSLLQHDTRLYLVNHAAIM